MAPMLLQLTRTLPRGPEWLYELKLDGYRGIAIKKGQTVRLLSRNRNDLARRFPRLVAGILARPCESAILDGEIVCLNEQGHPCFEDLQGFHRSREQFVFFYAFDLMHLDGSDLCSLPLTERNERLQALLTRCNPCLRLSEALDANPDDLVAFARSNKMEGVVAKRRDSRYEPGKRSGAWQKFKTYQEADFLVGGFLPSPDGFSAIAVGFRDGKHSDMRPSWRFIYRRDRKAQMAKAFLTKITTECPFASLPRKIRGDAWSVGLTTEEQEQFVWVKPKVRVTKAAEEKNAENLLVIDDAQLAHRYSDNWLVQAKHARAYKGKQR